LGKLGRRIEQSALGHGPSIYDGKPSGSQHASTTSDAKIAWFATGAAAISGATAAATGGSRGGLRLG
jgi:hypothetical protein